MAAEDFSSFDDWSNGSSTKVNETDSDYTQFKKDNEGFGRTWTESDEPESGVSQGDDSVRLQRPKEELSYETPEQVLVRYGVKVVFPINVGNLGILPRYDNFIPYPGFNAKFSPVNSETRIKVIKSLATTLQVYPSDFFRRNGISTFYVANLRKLGGAYDEITGGITLDASSLQYVGGERSVFHHEVNHRLVHRTKEGIRFKKRWEKIFPRITQLKSLFYKFTSRSLLDNEHLYMGKRFKKTSPERVKTQYFRDYGSMDASEDRATTSESLFAGPRFKYLLNTESPIKREKLEEMMSLYNDVSGGRMNEDFWADYAEEKVDSNYWRTRM